jgi:hypothetical protein
MVIYPFPFFLVTFPFILPSYLHLFVCLPLQSIGWNIRKAQNIPVKMEGMEGNTT